MGNRGKPWLGIWRVAATIEEWGTNRGTLPVLRGRAKLRQGEVKRLHRR